MQRQPFGIPSTHLAQEPASTSKVYDQILLQSDFSFLELEPSHPSPEKCGYN
jgi:hypothetical protein